MRRLRFATDAVRERRASEESRRAPLRFPRCRTRWAFARRRYWGFPYRLVYVSPTTRSASSLLRTAPAHRPTGSGDSVDRAASSKALQTRSTLEAGRPTRTEREARDLDEMAEVGIGSVGCSGRAERDGSRRRSAHARREDRPRLPGTPTGPSVSLAGHLLRPRKAEATESRSGTPCPCDSERDDARRATTTPAGWDTDGIEGEDRSLYRAAPHPDASSKEV